MSRINVSQFERSLKYLSPKEQAEDLFTILAVRLMTLVVITVETICKYAAAAVGLLSNTKPVSAERVTSWEVVFT